MFSKILVLFCFWSLALTESLFRIINGKNAHKGESPHLVMIESGYRPQIFNYQCGGSILNEYWILTAAHCAKKSHLNYRIKAGRTVLKGSEESEQTVPVESVFLHEKYNELDILYDIALLKLKEPLTFNEYVRPIKLPAKDSPVTGDVMIAGWGSTNPTINMKPTSLQKVILSVIDFETCKKAVEQLPQSPPIYKYQICTGPLTDKKANARAVCDGDSGSPLMKFEKDGELKIVGIASWTKKPCGIIKSPSVFTSVSSFTDWIKSTIDKNRIKES